MKKTALLFSLFLFSLSAYGGNLNFKKELNFKNNFTVFIQQSKTFRSSHELDENKGHCRLNAMSTGDSVIKPGTSLPVIQISSQLEVKKISMKFGGGATKEFELSCDMPEFPSQEKLRAIVLKNIQDDKEWTVRYNQMEPQKQAESLRIFMARAANEILDDEFDLIMSGVAKLEF